MASAQEVTINEFGLSIAQLGHKIDSAYILPLDMYQERKLLTSFNEEFDYHFIAQHSLLIANTGSTAEVFLATSKLKEIVGIFLFFNFLDTKIEEILTTVFGQPKLQSKSSIAGNYTGSKVFWKKNDVSIFLEFSSSSYSQVIITQIPFEKKTPSIYIRSE